MKWKKRNINKEWREKYGGKESLRKKEHGTGKEMVGVGAWKGGGGQHSPKLTL